MSRIKKEILNKLKEYAGKMGRDHLGGDDYTSKKKGGLRDFDGYDNVDYNKDMPMDEASRGTIHKAAKKGSYPVSLVVVKDGKVINQVLIIKTPAEVPAAFNVVKNYHKHKGATVHIEDRTGKRLFSESVNEDSPESAHPQGSKKLTNRTTVMDMLDVISHKEFGPDYHKLSTKQKKEVHKLAIKGKLIKQSPFKESVNEILVIVDKFDKRKQDYDKVYYQDGGKRPGDGDINKAQKEFAKLSKKHKDLTLISVGRNSKMYDVNESIEESMFSAIDQIRQDSKDVRDFVKNVFKDREFKKMSTDKEFIKYLKSIYEGTTNEDGHPQNWMSGRTSDYHTALRGKNKDYSGGTNFKKKNHGQPDVEEDDEDQETNHLSNKQTHIKSPLKMAESGKKKSDKNYKDWKSSRLRKEISKKLKEYGQRLDLSFIEDEEAKLDGTYPSTDAIDRDIDETAKRDYKDEYKKFQSSTKAKKYRAELNKYN